MAKLQSPTQPDVTPDNMMEHPSTPPDMLHDAVTSATSKGADMQDEDRSKVTQALAHPNTSAKTLAHAYNHFFPSNDPAAANAGLDNSADDNSDQMEAIMAHPNTPPEVVSDFLKRTFKLGTYHMRHAKESAHKRKGVPDSLKEDLLHNLLQDKDADKSLVEDFKLHPDTYFKLLEKRPIPEPETARMTDLQKDKNKFVGKIDAAVLSGLADTDKHDKQSLARAVDFYTSQKPPYGMSEEDRRNSLHRFVIHQQDIPTESLSHLNELKKPSGKDDWSLRQQIVNHQNADPALIAKLAQTTPGPGNTDSDDSWEAKEAVSAAIASKKLPAQTRKSLIGSVNPDSPSDDDKVSALLQNPSTTPDEVVHLYQKGFTDKAITDQRLPDDLVNQFAESQGATTEGARTLLQRKDIPSKALLQLVSHKNQNVAIDALKHKDVDMDVINAALKRKAKDVQDAASRHPLVAKQVMRDRLKTGQMDAHDLLFNKENKQAFGELTPDDVSFINRKYSMHTPDAAMGHDEDPDFWDVKGYLANNENVPNDIQSQNKKDIVDHFLRSTKPDTMIPGGAKLHGSSGYRSEVEADQSVNSKVARHVADLAAKGDNHARQAALTRPYLLHELSLDNPSYDGTYLRNAYQKMQQYEKANLPAREGIYDHEGGDNFFKVNKEKIGRNPSTPEDVFSDLYNNPEYLKNPSTYSTVGHKGGDSDKGNTVFDSRWSQLPDTLKRERFEKLHSIGNEDSDYAVAMSNEAPKDLWRDAFLNLTNESRAKFLGNMDVSRLADEDTKREILSGNHPGADHEGLKNVLDSLNPSNAQDWDHFDHFLNDYAYKYVNHNRLSNESIAAHVPEGFIKSDAGKKKMAEILENSPGLAARLAADNSSSDEFQDFMGLMHSGTETMFPDEKAQVMERRWRSALEEKDEYSYRSSRNPKLEDSILDKYIGSKDDPNGELDFLADMPSDIKAAALNRGLISHAKTVSDIARTPDELSGLLKTDHYTAARRIQEVLQAPQLDDGFLHSVINNLNDSAFSARTSGREKMDDTGFSKVKSYTDKLLSHTLSSGDPIKNTSDAVYNLLAKKSSQHGSLSMDRKKELGQHIISSIEASAMPETQKNSALLSLADAFEQNENPTLPANLKKNIIKRALASGDIESITKAAQTPEGLSREAANAVLGAFENPEKLTNNQIASLMKVASRKDISIGSVQKAFDIMGDRKNSALEAGNQAEFDSIGSMIVQAANDGIRSNKDGEKGRYYLSTLLNYSNSPGDAGDMSRSGLMSVLPSLNTDEATDVFTSLPDSMPPDPKTIGDSNINHIVLNDPRVIASAAKGWKLDYMAMHAHSLGQENAEVIGNRVMNDPETPEMTKHLFAMNLLRNDQASAELTTSALRATGEDGVFDAVESALAGSKNDSWSDTNLHHALPLMNSEIERTLSQDAGTYRGAPFSKMDRNHVSRLDRQLLIASSVFNTDVTDPDRNSQGGTRHQIVEEQTEKFTDNVNKFTHAAAEAVNSGALGQKDLDMIATSLEHICKNLIETRGEVSPKNSLGVLETTTYPDKLAEAAREKFGPDFDTSGIKMSPNVTSNLLLKLMRKGGFSKEDWGKALTIQPSIVGSLGDLREIPGYMIDAIDMDNADLGDHTIPTIAQWIGKIAKDDQARIVPKLLDHATASYVNSDGYDEAYTDTLNEAFENAPDHIKPEFMHSLPGLIKNKEAYNQLMDTAVQSGAGGPSFCRSVVDKRIQDFSDMETKEQKQLAKCPYLTDDHIGKILRKKNLNNIVVDTLADNKSLGPDSVGQLVNFVMKKPEDYASDSTIRSLVSNPGIAKDDFMKLSGTLENANPQSKRAYYSNPKWGGEAFRKAPVSLPSDLFKGKETAKVVKEADYNVPRERLNRLLSVVPPEGIDWVSFKKANKNMENLPEVKSLFMSKKGNIVTPEDVVQAVKGSDDPFHVTYGTWNGAQRHSNSENLVIQMNLSDKMEKDIAEDPLRWALYTGLTGAMMGSHPATPRIAGWCRVDTKGGKKGWIAEEFQSDFDGAEDWAKHVCDTGKMELNGKPVTEGQIADFCKYIRSRIKNWHMASMKALEDLAKLHGVSNIYIHGEGIRSTMSGFDEKRESPVRVKEMYDKTPEKLGWAKVDYSDYPNQGTVNKEAEQSGRSTHVWKKKLTKA